MAKRGAQWILWVEKSLTTIREKLDRKIFAGGPAMKIASFEKIQLYNTGLDMDKSLPALYACYMHTSNVDEFLEEVFNTKVYDTKVL